MSRQAAVAESHAGYFGGLSPIIGNSRGESCQGAKESIAVARTAFTMLASQMLNPGGALNQQRRSRFFSQRDKAARSAGHEHRRPPQ